MNPVGDMDAVRKSSDDDADEGTSGADKGGSVDADINDDDAEAENEAGTRRVGLSAEGTIDETGKGDAGS